MDVVIKYPEGTKQLALDLINTSDKMCVCICVLSENKYKDSFCSKPDTCCQLKGNFCKVQDFKHFYKITFFASLIEAELSCYLDKSAKLF